MANAVFDTETGQENDISILYFCPLLKKNTKQNKKTTTKLKLKTLNSHKLR